MRALVLSDSHGDEFNLRWLLECVWKMTGPIDYYLHLGDGASDFQRLENFIRGRDANAACIGVRGNCDFYEPDLPDTVYPRIGGVDLLMTHGHRYGVKQELSSLRFAARDRGCRAALFGHTHEPFLEDEDGLLLLNPGAARDGRCALLTCENGRVSARLIEC